MQLENYERSMLAINEEEEGEQDLLVPIFNGHETNMSTEQANRFPLPQRGIENNSERIEHNHNAMTHGQRRNMISVNTRLRGRQQHRLRRNKSKSLRRNIHRNSNQASIPIRYYNSLRIMVPSVASNSNASKLTVVDEAVRYIRELETALENKVNSEGGLHLPEVEVLAQTTNPQSTSSSENSSSYHSLDNVFERSRVPPSSTNNGGVNNRDKSIDLRNLVSQFIITSQRRYIHDCTEILHRLHKTSIVRARLNCGNAIKCDCNCG